LEVDDAVHRPRVLRRRQVDDPAAAVDDRRRRAERRSGASAPRVPQQRAELVRRLAQHPHRVDGEPPAPRIEEHVLVVQVAVQEPRRRRGGDQLAEARLRPVDERGRNRRVTRVSVALEPPPRSAAGGKSVGSPGASRLCSAAATSHGTPVASSSRPACTSPTSGVPGDARSRRIAPSARPRSRTRRLPPKWWRAAQARPSSDPTRATFTTTSAGTPCAPAVSPTRPGTRPKARHPRGVTSGAP
jgi:hypothetical protein